MAQHNISFNNSTGSDDDLISREWNTFLSKQGYAYFVFVCLLSIIEIPIMILTLIGLCFLIKSRPAASVFVSHLILSDLIQVICVLISTATTWSWSWSYNLYVAYHYSLIVGVYFMACVAFERYLLVSHPIWYKSHQSLKLSCFISVIIWCVPLIFAEIKPSHIYFPSLHWSIACLVAYAIIILCFVGTRRGLSRSISLTPLKRKLILGSLFLVLLTYTCIILPFVIVKLIMYYFNYPILFGSPLFFLKCLCFVHLLLYVNPLADCMLYLLIRPDVGDMMKSVFCCCLRHNQEKHSVVNPQNSCSTVVCSISAQKPESHSLNTFSSV